MFLCADLPQTIVRSKLAMDVLTTISTSPVHTAQSGVKAPDLKGGAAPHRARAKKKIWIDLDNSPHVPFFLPIIDELRKRGYRIILTARNSYQVCELLAFHHVSCKIVGRHWGRNRILKALGTVIRAAKLLPIVTERPDLAVSHGSRAQLLTSSLLGIPTLMIVDYEFTAPVGTLRADWLLVPRFIPGSLAHRVRKEVFKYPGLKEDVYIPRFRPDPSLRKNLGLDPRDLVVTVRPPATEAHYHNAESEVLLDEVLRFLCEHPESRVVLLPRNERQKRILHAKWAAWIKSGKIVIPESVVDGLNLIWLSDLIISGGGTMNREAAALGIPVYSIFRGRIGGVDRYLAENGRLVLIEKVEDVRAKIVLKRRQRVDHISADRGSTLEYIVSTIASAVERDLISDHRSH